ncbi:hypothetical protein ACI2IX_03775 [Leifsonia aquatica]|uniref:hypothetical protein n=1 Tax=Leifsonia aquatica TaxID=144185 RepID=UPI00384EC96B
MPHLVYTSASDWLAAVERRVSDPAIADALRSRDLPAGTVLAVARAEAENAGPTGRVTLDAEKLARAAGVTPRDAKRARIALITVGAQVFVAMPGSTGRPVRQLQMPHRS